MYFFLCWQFPCVQVSTLSINNRTVFFLFFSTLKLYLNSYICPRQPCQQSTEKNQHCVLVLISLSYANICHRKACKRVHHCGVVCTFIFIYAVRQHRRRLKYTPPDVGAFSICYAIFAAREVKKVYTQWMMHMHGVNIYAAYIYHNSINTFCPCESVCTRE